MEIQIKETAASREKVVKSYAQRQKEYRTRKKIEKLRLCPKKIPKTNAENQRKYRQNLKGKPLSESLILARRRKNAERAKRYRDNLKLKKQLDSMSSWTEDSLSSVLIKYTKEVGHDETNCEDLVFSRCQSNMNQIPSMINGAQQVTSPSLESFEAHSKCSTPNALLNHETNIAVDEQQLDKGTQMSENKPPEQCSRSNQLIIPKTEVLDEVEITFEDREDNKNLITPKKELSDGLSVNNHRLEYKAYLLKLIKTEPSEDIDQPQHECTQLVSEQNTIPNVKMEPGLGGSVLPACPQTCAPPLRSMTEVSRHNCSMEELPKDSSQTDNLITPKKEILDDIEVTFENHSEGNTDLIIPKEEVSNRSMQLVNERQWEHSKNLLKPIKTETLMSEDIARLRRQHESHTQTTLNQITRHSVDNIKVEPGAAASVSEDCAQTVSEMSEDITQRNARNCKRYYLRKKSANQGVVKKKNNSEKCRQYRQRKKKLLAQQLESMNGVIHTPSTSSLQMTFEPQLITTDIVMQKEVKKRSRGSGKDKNGSKVRKVPKTGAERIRDYRERIRAMEKCTPSSEVRSTASQHLEGSQVDTNQSSRSERNATDKQEACDNHRQFLVQVKSVAGSLYLAISTTDCEDSDKKRITS